MKNSLIYLSKTKHVQGTPKILALDMVKLYWSLPQDSHHFSNTKRLWVDKNVLKNWYLKNLSWRNHVQGTTILFNKACPWDTSYILISMVSKVIYRWNLPLFNSIYAQNRITNIVTISHYIKYWEARKDKEKHV